MRGRISLLVAFVLVLRSLMPAGYMPVQTANGISIVICTSKGSKAVTVDADGKIVDDHGGGQVFEPCAFSGLGVIALAAVDAPLHAPDVTEATGRFALSFGLPPIRAGPALGSRAPPLHS